MPKARTIGNRIAPPLFLMFVAVLVAASSVAIGAMEDVTLAAMVGFDIAAGLFVLSCAPMLRVRNSAVVRAHAEDNDANRTLLLAITITVIMVLLMAIAAETTGNRPQPFTKGLVIVTLVLAWMFSNTVYALHYAHLAYSRDHDLGLDFPDTPQPVYWDFVYFAFTIGMTFQTSDVTIRSDRIRRVATVHSFAAFIFNIGVLAFTINVLGN